MSVIKSFLPRQMNPIHSLLQMKKQSKLMGQAGLLMLVAVQGEGLEEQKRLLAKRLIRKLFKNLGDSGNRHGGKDCI